MAGQATVVTRIKILDYEAASDFTFLVTEQLQDVLFNVSDYEAASRIKFLIGQQL